MIHKFLVQVDVSDSWQPHCCPNVLRTEIRNKVQELFRLPGLAVVTCIREEMPEVFGPEMHFRPCDCGAWAGCKKCNGLGVIKFTPVS